jgi:tetratricopeptide (TPR) repeat protein
LPKTGNNIMDKRKNIMTRNTIIKMALLVLAVALIACGRGYWGRCKLAQDITKDVDMGRYNKAFDSLEEVRGSKLYRISKYFDKEDPYVTYNIGVVLMLMGDTKKAGAEFKHAIKSDNEAIKESAIYNRANIIATNMDFATAAEEYSKALKIDPDDFKAKKNLERMRRGQKQLSTLFSPVKQEREERIQSLKLIPWGNRYRHSGEQKIRW